MGNNIKGLDALHQVMKGDMTVDQACEGMTDDFEIGHVSHRADGDYRKVAQGKWVPVKAAGQGQMGTGEKANEKPAEQKDEPQKDNPYKRDQDDFMSRLSIYSNKIKDPSKVSVKRTPQGNWQAYYDGGFLGTFGGDTLDPEAAEELGWFERPAPDFADEQDGGTESDGPDTAMQDERSQFKFRKHITHAIPMGKEEEIALNRISSYFESGRRNASDAIDNYADHLIKENMENGNNNEAQERAVMRIAHAIGYGHELHDKIKRGRNGYDFGYDDEQGSFYEGDNDEAPAEEPKTEGGKRQLKRRADGTVIYETPDDVIYDMVENYNELDRGDLQGVIEAAAMSHGWDENEILEEVDRQAAEKYDLGVDSADGVVKKVAELAQRDYKDVPGRVLTADTKIRLSRIKREQTQDKKYNVGEISQKTGLQKQQDGSWAPPKQGRGSAYQESDKKVEALRGRGFNRTQLKNMRTSELDKLYESEIGGSAGAPAGGKAEINPVTGKPLRPETVAYAKQKKAEAEQKRNTEKTAGGFTLAQNDKIKNAALDVITKRRGERLTAKNLKRDYKMSDEEANETVRRVNEYFENLQKDRKEFSKR